MDENVQLVVAKYTEDVSWVDKIDFPAIVYDKSGQDCQHPLPNIGRESHTYLHYILSKYPFFSEYTIFLQGDPFSHLPYGVTVKDLQRIITDFVSRKAFFRGFAGYSIRCDGSGKPNDLGSSMTKWASRTDDIPVSKIYGELFHGKVPDSYHCRAPAGIFGVHKDRILCRPLGFYKCAMNLVMRDPCDVMNTGHAFERLWYIIFNGYNCLNKDRY